MTRHALIALSLLILLGSLGCSSTPSITRYQIKPSAQIEETEGRQTNLVLAVDYFTADVAYDEDRIVYRKGPYHLDYYHYHRWAAAPGLMLTDALRSSYSKSGYFRLVTAGGAARADVVLSGRVTAIEEVDVSENEWMGRIVLEMQLRDAATGALLWTQTYEEEEPLEQNDPEGLTAALSRAVTRIVEDSTPKIAEVARSAQRGS